MKLITEISDKSLGIGERERYDKPYRLRKTARAVLVRDDGMIAFQHISKLGYYKLPGGGLEVGENISEGLARELKEEVGCAAEVLQNIGMVIEYRNRLDVLQISYCYLCKVIGEIGEPKFDDGEIEDGNVSIWVSYDEALDLLQREVPEDYEGKFIVKRELEVLKMVKDFLIQSNLL